VSLKKKKEKYLDVSEAFWMQFLLFPPVQWMEFASSVAFWGSDLSHSSPFVPEYE
jgi:hypothetical protein